MSYKSWWIGSGLAADAAWDVVLFMLFLFCVIGVLIWFDH